MVELVKLKETPNVTFDEAVNDLLDKVTHNFSKRDEGK